MLKGKELAIQIVSGLLILLFCYTALSKLMNWNYFASILSQGAIIGKFSNILAWTIPISEIIIVVLLIVPFTRGIGLWSSFLLLSLFTIYLTLMLLFKRHDLPCSCGGVISKLSWGQHLVFNLLLIGLSIWAITLLKQNKNFLISQIEKRNL